jgi:Flp pilus assembly protein TadD
VVAILVARGMSIINQVLKDLDRQGANTRAPRGVIAVDQTEPGSARRPLWLGLGLLVLLAAVWRWWPTPLDSTRTNPMPAPTLSPPLGVSPATPAEPRLRMSLQLGEAGRIAGAESSQVVGADASRGTSPSAPAADIRDNPPAGRIAFIPQPPRLDTRLPELPARPAPEAAPGPAQTGVVKQIKPLTPQVQAEDAWRQAGRLLEQGREHDARQHLEQALSFDPAHLAARQRLVALVLAASDMPRAEVLLREGLALHPNDPWYPRSLAQLRMQQGDFVHAAEILNAALAKRPDAANWALYAGTLTRLEQPGEAARAYREALRLDATQGNWWIGMAVALEQISDPAAAGEAYRRALQTRLSNELRDFAQQKLREAGGL